MTTIEEIKKFIVHFFENSLHDCKTISEFQQLLFDKFYNLDLVKSIVKKDYNFKKLSLMIQETDWELLANPNCFSYFLYRISGAFDEKIINNIIKYENNTNPKSIKEECNYYATEDDYIIYMVELYCFSSEWYPRISYSWLKYFEIYRPDIILLLDTMSENITSQLVSGVKLQNLDWTFENEDVINIIENNQFIEKGFIKIKLSTILNVPNYSRKDYHIDCYERSYHWQGIGGELNFHSSTSFENNTRLYEQWVFKRTCTDTWVGLRAFYLDDKLVAIANQNERKDYGYFYWTSKEDVENVIKYLCELSALTQRQTHIFRLEKALAFLKNQEEYGDDWEEYSYIDFDYTGFSRMALDEDNQYYVSVFK